MGLEVSSIQSQRSLRFITVTFTLKGLSIPAKVQISKEKDLLEYRFHSQLEPNPK